MEAAEASGADECIDTQYTCSTTIHYLYCPGAGPKYREKLGKLIMHYLAIQKREQRVSPSAIGDGKWSWVTSPLSPCAYL
jgi:hypothetical protein